MNAKQIGDLVRSLLLSLGVSSSVIAWFGDEVYVAVGSAILAVGVGIWQLVSSRLWKLLKTVEEDPEVVKVIVTNKDLADTLGRKVEPLR